MASRWFRLYDDFLDDPKVQMLDLAAFRTLVNLWCLTSKSGGILPPIAQIAAALGLEESDAQDIVDDFAAREVFDLPFRSPAQSRGRA